MMVRIADGAASLLGRTIIAWESRSDSLTDPNRSIATSNHSSERRNRHLTRKGSTAIQYQRVYSYRRYHPHNTRPARNGQAHCGEQWSVYFFCDEAPAAPEDTDSLARCLTKRCATILQARSRFLTMELLF